MLVGERVDPDARAYVVLDHGLEGEQPGGIPGEDAAVPEDALEVLVAVSRRRRRTMGMDGV